MSNIKTRQKYLRRITEQPNLVKSGEDATATAPKDEVEQMLEELHGKKVAPSDVSEANDIGLIDARDPKEYAHQIFMALLDKIKI